MGITLEIQKRLAVLVSIVDLGGNGTKKDVLDNLRDKNYIKISEDDKKIMGGRPEERWRNDFAFIRKHLVTERYIDDAEYNNWEITQQGKEYLRELYYIILDYIVTSAPSTNLIPLFDID